MTLNALAEQGARHENLLTALAGHAAGQRNAIALESGECSLSYGELYERTRRLKGALAAKSVTSLATRSAGVCGQTSSIRPHRTTTSPWWSFDEPADRPRVR